MLRYNLVFDSWEKIQRQNPLILKGNCLFLALENVVWSAYTEIFLNFLFNSFGR